MAATHLRAHLGARLEPDGDERIAGVIPLTSASRNRDGTVSIGAVATMVDVATVVMASRSHPSSLVTAHLALRMPSSPTGSFLRATSVVIRSNKGGTTSLAHTRDDQGRVVAVATVSGGALGGEGGSHKFNPNRTDDMYERWEVPPDAPCMDDYLAIEPIGVVDGRRAYRMPFHEPLRNRTSVLHGGGHCLIVEHAARLAAADAGAHWPYADTLDVHYLSPGLVGPFEAYVDVAPSVGGDHLAMSVEVIDAGRDGRRIALGLCTTRDA